jgi:hypothetical protein
MSIILAALLAAPAPQAPAPKQDKASEACPSTATFTFKSPPEATPKAKPAPKTSTVQTLNVPTTKPGPKPDDCVTPKPKTVKGS